MSLFTLGAWRTSGVSSTGTSCPSTEDDDSRCIDSHAKRTLSRAVQSDAQIKDLDVSPHFFFIVATHDPFFFFSEQATRTLGQFQSD